MHFAKLFSYTVGQLVVTWDNLASPEDHATPYCITTITRGQIVTATMQHLYQQQAVRDADFEAFEELAAHKLFTSQQQFLAANGDTTMQMDFAKLFEFQAAEGFPEGQLLMQVQDSDAREDADAPYQLVLSTMSPYGRMLKKVVSYTDEPVRDAEFDTLPPLAAEGIYRGLQARLAAEFQLATA